MPKRYSYDRRKPEDLTTLDSAYFHAHNGGLSIKVVEKDTSHKSYDGKWNESYEYQLVLRDSGCGPRHEYTLEFPNYAAAEWLSDVFARLSVRMQEKVKRYYSMGTIQISILEKEQIEDTEYTVDPEKRALHVEKAWPGMKDLPRIPPKPYQEIHEGGCSEKGCYSRTLLVPK